MGGEDLGPHAKPSWACSAGTPWREQVVTRNEEERGGGCWSGKCESMWSWSKMTKSTFDNLEILSTTSCTTSYHIVSFYYIP